MQDILETIETNCAQNRAFTLITLLDSEGSTTAKMGVHAIVDPDGWN